MKKQMFAFLILCFSSAYVFSSPVDTYQFRDQVTKNRYQDLVKELRCPKCQNQNLADSNSQIAVDLRAQVYDMLNADKSDGEIVNYMVERYGDFVLYRPQVSSLTYILWYGPLGLLLIGGFIMFMVLRKKPNEQADVKLSAEQEQKLQQFLKDK